MRAEVPERALGDGARTGAMQGCQDGHQPLYACASLPQRTPQSTYTRQPRDAGTARGMKPGRALTSWSQRNSNTNT